MLCVELTSQDPGSYETLLREAEYSSLLSLISVVELTRAGQRIAIDRFMPVEGLVATALGYLVLYYVLKSAAGAWQARNSLPGRG